MTATGVEMSSRAWLPATLLVFALAGPAIAQGPTQPMPPAAQTPPVQGQTAPAVGAPAGATPSRAAPDRCADRGRVLGVSRIVTIDTTTGPRFGHQQYKDHDLLADGEVVLTFDDGPLRAHTQAVVDVLDAQCTKATFFMVGSQALADPDMVRQIARKGHTIATHTWSHANLRQRGQADARRELELGFSAVAHAAGQPIAPFFRFPFLADSTAMKAYAQQRGVGIFSIEIDALDYRNKEDPGAVHAEVMKQLAWHRKGILLFHDIQPSTAAALPGLLAAIKAKGFKVVHMKPEAPIQTLAEFDAVVRRDAGARRVAQAANPMAARAVTWPLPKAGTTAPFDPAAGPPPPPPAPFRRQPAVPAGGVFPPYQPYPAAAPPPAVLPPPPRPPRPAEDWRNRVFNPN